MEDLLTSPRFWLLAILLSLPGIAFYETYLKPQPVGVSKPFRYEIKHYLPDTTIVFYSNEIDRSNGSVKFYDSSGKLRIITGSIEVYAK